MQNVGKKLDRTHSFIAALEKSTPGLDDRSTNITDPGGFVVKPWYKDFPLSLTLSTNENKNRVLTLFYRSEEAKEWRRGIRRLCTIQRFSLSRSNQWGIAH